MNLFQKLAVASVGTALSFAAIDANLAQAATLTQTFTTTLEPVSLVGPVLDYRATGNFTQFNPQLGTLTNVSLNINPAGTITDDCLSSGCGPSVFTQTILGESSAPLLSLSGNIGTGFFPPGVTSEPFSSSQSETAENVTGFVGFGGIPFQSDIFISFPRQQQQFVSLSGTETASLTYTYSPAQSVPEPSSNPAMEALVTLGIGGLLLKKKVALSTKSPK